LIIYLLIATAIFFLAWLVSYPFDKKKEFLKYVSMLYSKGIILINPLWRIKIIGKENMRKGVAYVVCINHRQMLDIPLINTLNINMRWVSKRDVYKLPFIGAVLRMRDDIAIDRGGVASTKMMFRRCKDEIARGVSIGIFPEGTRSKTGRLEEFKDGGFLTSKQSNTPILPIVTTGTWEAERVGKYKLKYPLTFLISILPEITTEEVAKLSTKELSKKVHEIMLEEHIRISPDVYKPENKDIK
ncbi:MAG: lysophospholipid acyltransferase family protein, partial [Rikenellaceae bacterium]